LRNRDQKTNLGNTEKNAKKNPRNTEQKVENAGNTKKKVNFRMNNFFPGFFFPWW
jgi:hypothetical protein